MIVIAAKQDVFSLNCNFSSRDTMGTWRFFSHFRDLFLTDLFFHWSMQLYCTKTGKARAKKKITTFECNVALHR